MNIRLIIEENRCSSLILKIVDEVILIFSIRLLVGTGSQTLTGWESNKGRGEKKNVFPCHVRTNRWPISYQANGDEKETEGKRRGDTASDTIGKRVKIAS